MSVTVRDKTKAGIAEDRQFAELERLTHQTVRRIAEAFEDDDSGWLNVGNGSQPATYSGGLRSIKRGGFSRIDDRADGKYLPFYETEQHLQSMRAKCRELATFTSVSIGALQALRVYTVGGAWEFEAIGRRDEEPLPELLAEVQRILDANLERNAWTGDLDAEVHDYGREDGESLLAMYATPDGLVDMDRLEPDCLRAPASPGVLTEWLGGTPKDCSWTFGVLTTRDERMNRINHARHVGYHCVFDDSGTEWDYLPAWPLAIGDDDLDGKCLHFIKRNTPRKAKRGLSDFWPVLNDLEREDKVSENTAVGIAILASIPWIEEMPEGTSREQALAQIGNALDAYSNRLTAARGGERKVNRLRPGTALRVGAGRKYHAGPMGAARHQLYIEVMQHLKRRIGIRWLMPEYMISADASNANYASTLVAESPFVKAREADQYFYSQHFKLVLMKALKIAVDHGRFRSYGIGSWGEFVAQIDVRIQPPPVATRNKAELLSELSATYDRGLMDGNEWRLALGYDEKEGFEEKTGSGVGGPMDAGVSSLMAGLGEGATIEDARAIYEAYRATS